MSSFINSLENLKPKSPNLYLKNPNHQKMILKFLYKMKKKAAEKSMMKSKSLFLDLPPDKMVLTPEEDDRWGLIGDYSENLEYDYSEGVFDYVVAEGTVFYPVFNPNPDEPGGWREYHKG